MPPTKGGPIPSKRLTKVKPDISEENQGASLEAEATRIDAALQPIDDALNALGSPTIPGIVDSPEVDKVSPQMPQDFAQVKTALRALTVVSTIFPPLFPVGVSATIALWMMQTVENPRANQYLREVGLQAYEWLRPIVSEEKNGQTEEIKARLRTFESDLRKTLLSSEKMNLRDNVILQDARDTVRRRLAEIQKLHATHVDSARVYLKKTQDSITVSSNKLISGIWRPTAKL